MFLILEKHINLVISYYFFWINRKLIVASYAFQSTNFVLKNLKDRQKLKTFSNASAWVTSDNAHFSWMSWKLWQIWKKWKLWRMIVPAYSCLWICEIVEKLWKNFLYLHPVKLTLKICNFLNRDSNLQNLKKNLFICIKYLCNMRFR